MYVNLQGRVLFPGKSFGVPLVPFAGTRAPTDHSFIEKGPPSYVAKASGGSGRERKSSMNSAEILIGLAVLVLVAVGIVLWSHKRKREQIRSRFGSEYTRTVANVGDERKAEAVLAEREKRVSAYTIKPLLPAMRDHFVDTWRDVQARFVDDPKYAVTRADDLLGEVMSARGYPVKDDFNRRAEDLSVDHSEVVQNYRSGHDIAMRHSRGEASTEDLRTAMIHYRALFDDLVNEPESTHPRHPVTSEKHLG
jgi:hypothetical protein